MGQKQPWNWPLAFKTQIPVLKHGFGSHSVTNLGVTLVVVVKSALIEFLLFIIQKPSLI